MSDISSEIVARRAELRELVDAGAAAEWRARDGWLEYRARGAWRRVLNAEQADAALFDPRTEARRAVRRAVPFRILEAFLCGALESGQ